MSGWGEAGRGGGEQRAEPRTGPGSGSPPPRGMAGRSEGPRLRLQECQHGCKKHLGDIISFFFRFISGNLARGEGCSVEPGSPRWRAERHNPGAGDPACLWHSTDQGQRPSDRTGQDPSLSSVPLAVSCEQWRPGQGCPGGRAGGEGTSPLRGCAQTQGSQAGPLPQPSLPPSVMVTKKMS